MKTLVFLRACALFLLSIMVVRDEMVVFRGSYVGWLEVVKSSFIAALTPNFCPKKLSVLFSIGVYEKVLGLGCNTTSYTYCLKL